MTTATLTAPRRAKPLPSGPTTGRKRFLLDLRNSTLGQVDNYSAKEQVDAMVRVTEQRHPGSEVVIIDEQGTSGTDMSKRHVFRAALEEIGNGTAHGIVVYDIKRLSRDPFGIDGGRLAKLLVEHHGIVVTMARDYNPRLDHDLTAFNMEGFMAGIDLRGIRNTLARGLFKKMETEAVFRRPPLGYMTVREFGARPGTLNKFAAKNPEHAHAMAGIQLAFDACDSVQAACVWLAEHGYERPPVAYGDKVVDYWTPRMLNYVLEKNEIYTGTFVFGKDGSRISPVWEATGRQNDGPIVTAAPDLAYWTLADAARWRRKFLSSRRSEMTHSRVRKHPHPFTGVLNCGVCGLPMVGAGKGLYRCQGTTTMTCSEWVSAPAMLKTLLPLLPGLLADARGIVEEWARQANHAGESATQSELVAVEARASALRKKFMMLEEPDAEIAAELDGLNRRVKVLRVRVTEDAAEAANAVSTADLVDMLETLPHLFADLTEEHQSRIYSMLLSDVRLTGTGKRGGRRFTVKVATPRLAIPLSDPLRPKNVSYASIFVDLLNALTLESAA